MYQGFRKLQQILREEILAEHCRYCACRELVYLSYKLYAVVPSGVATICQQGRGRVYHPYRERGISPPAVGLFLKIRVSKRNETKYHYSPCEHRYFEIFLSLFEVNSE